MPAKGQWRDFEEAREYARSLGLSWWREWKEHAKSGALPPDIPREPSAVYKDSGWVSVGDWLGTGNIATYKRKYRPFEEARAYMHSVGLKSQTEWKVWCQTDAKPPDIPTNPNKIYADEWVGYWDFLGTGNRRGGWRSFEEAREHVRGLGLKNKDEWSEYAKGGALPPDIPKAPRKVYEDEWRGIWDWLGIEDVPRRMYRSFEEAQEYGRSLGIKTGEEWYRWSASGQKPPDIPSRPDHIYPDRWRGWGEFLGTGNVLSKQWRPFEEARAYVRSLGLRSTVGWYEYCKSDKKPDDIPTNPNSVYATKRRGDKRITQNTNTAVEEQGEWRGWADWLGVVSQWNRANLLAFLADLRPRLKDLEETELYLILQQGGAMPGLQKALGKTPALGVLKDLKENDGRTIEAALGAAADEEIADSYAEHNLPAKEQNEALEEHTPEDEELQEDLLETGGLAALATPEALRLVDDLAGLHYGLDDETAQYLVDNRIAGLWQAYTDDGEVALDSLRGEGGRYFQLIRARFYAELEGARNLPIPAGWAFRPPGSEHEAPTPPNLMQRRTAHVLTTRKRLGNWSGVGSGKTLSGILASRVAGCEHTLVICNKATVAGWCREIRNAFPDSVVRTHVDGPIVGAHLYTVLNYEKFQQRNRRALVEELIALDVDFVILDEVQFVKQRDKNVSARRQAIHALLSELEVRNPDLHVLGMSATPVINTLTEARKLVEIVTGRTFADLATQATVNNALAMHRTLKIHGLRYRPHYEIETITDTPTVVRNDLVDNLRAGEGVLHLEQTLLPPKLERVR
jgi:hypothetical protein